MFEHPAPPQQIFAIGSSGHVPAVGPGAEPSCPTGLRAGAGESSEHQRRCYSPPGGPHAAWLDQEVGMGNPKS